MTAEDMVLVGIITQQFQPITSKEIVKIAKEQGYELDESEVIYILENMQRKDILSVIWKDKNNLRIKNYGMAKPLFKKIPEIAHLKDLLPTLIKSKEAKELLGILEGKSSETTKRKLLGYRDYKKIKVTFQTIEPIVGGSLNKPDKLDKNLEIEIEKIKKKSKGKTDEETKITDIAYLCRDANGNIIYTRNAVRQYFLQNFRIAGLGESAINQIQFGIGQVQPNGHSPFLVQWPIIVQGQGRGVKTAEALPAGVNIDITFTFPFTGTKIKSPEQLRQVLEYIAENGRGFSCYSKKYGKCKLIKFEVEELPWEK